MEEERASVLWGRGGALALAMVTGRMQTREKTELPGLSFA